METQMNADGPQMNVLQERVRLNEISRTVIGAAQKVSSTLGTGFLEKVYENALCHEMRKAELVVHRQRPLQVMYDGIVVGDYFPDFVVEDAVIIEIKAVVRIEAAHRKQVLNYLRTVDFRLGLLLNFGSSHLEVGRVVNQF